jgi:2-keto-4-pentenoate hydratase/2-oxohepta-3-ene-1,7-dioic acid hydratase in catechol pathway
MHHRFDDLIAFVSRSETLHAGEVLGSGTVGTGCGLEHGRFLQPGDTIELEIDHIGVLRNRILDLDDAVPVANDSPYGLSRRSAPGTSTAP